MNRLFLLTVLALLGCAVYGRHHPHGRIQLYKQDTIRATLVDSGSLDVYIKHRQQNMQRRLSALLMTDESIDSPVLRQGVANAEIDEVLKNYMDVGPLYLSPIPPPPHRPHS